MERNAEPASSLIRAGFIQKAANSLSNNKSVLNVFNSNQFSIIQAFHSDAYYDCNNLPATNDVIVDERLVQKLIITNATRGSAGGHSGWNYNFLLLFINDKMYFSYLFNYQSTNK